MHHAQPMIVDLRNAFRFDEMASREFAHHSRGCATRTLCGSRAVPPQETVAKRQLANHGSCCSRKVGITKPASPGFTDPFAFGAVDQLRAHPLVQLLASHR